MAVAVAALMAPAAAAAAPQPSAPECAGAAETFQALAAPGMGASLLCLVNAERAGRGLGPVFGNERLRRAAQGHSEEMVARGYFEHVSPSGATLHQRAWEAGYMRRFRHWRLGEAIGWADGPIATPQRLMQAWMDSPPHRDIIVDRRFRELGVGVAEGVPEGGPGASVTLIFGVRTVASTRAARGRSSRVRGRRR